MRFEDMKNNIPETPDFIHEMIKNEVDRQLQETKIIAIPKKRKRWSFYKKCTRETPTPGKP